MRKILLLLFATIVSVSSFGQVTISQEDYNRLPEDVRSKIEKTSRMKEYSEYAHFGKEIGVAVNETLKAVEDSAVRISKTEIGQTAMFVLLWKFLYKDILGITAGFVCLIVCIGSFVWLIKKKDLNTDNAVIGALGCATLFIASMACMFG